MIYILDIIAERRRERKRERENELDMHIIGNINKLHSPL
jgi:hypothetical protein